jgi:hypothetical protein
MGMRNIITVVGLVLAALFGSYAADTKKDVTTKQIVGTWKYAEYYKGKVSIELITIFSPAGKFYTTAKVFNADG